MSLYFTSLSGEMRFVDMIHAAQKRDGICISLRFQKWAEDPAQNFGVILNPPKDRVFTLTNWDSLVVLSEDEL